ncbi:uncharacterized protein LOC100842768 isoform X2 [Brachypodium distachyon]|nr:uncharacterized protein LOC100842768 isoform X2 [Brachypodium distachyon]|eukprot:XP_024316665.1 uncharacterized protein LOC100842768 isoform X2 [Brachypodium distachyon]
MRPTAAATKSASFFLAKHQSVVPAPSAAAADPRKASKEEKTKRCSGRRSWRAAAAGSNGGGGDEYSGQSVSTTEAAPGRRRRARLSARRRERIRLLDVLPEHGGGGGGGMDIGEFLRHPAGVESLLNTRALESFAPVESAESGGSTFRCTLQRMGFLGFQVAPVLDLRVAPTCADCTVEMLSCKFEGSDSIEQQNELFSAFMRNHITWGGNGDDEEEPCLDIDVNLEVTLEVYTKPFSLLPLSAVEKPGNL